MKIALDNYQMKAINIKGYKNFSDGITAEDADIINLNLMERETMKNAKLVLANYDARISKIDIKPKNKHTKIILSSRILSSETTEIISSQKSSARLSKRVGASRSISFSPFSECQRI